MNAAFWGTGLSGLIVAISFLLLLRRLAMRAPDAQPDLNWCRDFTVAKYRPMERLFSEGDYEFLAAQPGFSVRITRRLQAERRRIFRRYLRVMSRDFERLLLAAKTMLVHSSQDCPDLAKALIRCRLVFLWALAQVQLRLALEACGIGTVNVRPLVEALEALSTQLHAVPVAARQAA